MKDHYHRWGTAPVALGFAIACWLSYAVAEDQPTVSKSASTETSTHAELDKPEAAIQEALESQTEIEFDAVPLNEAIDRIKEKHHIPIFLDEEALKASGIDSASALVSINVRGIALRSAIDLLLTDFNLVCIVKDQVLQVTTKEKADGELASTVYDVRDLLQTDNNGQANYGNLLALLRASVATLSWSEVGGSGTGEPGPRGTLVIAQTQQAQRDIQNLFSALRHAKDRIKEGKWEPTITVGSTPADKKIEMLLADKVDLNFDHIPLKEAINQLRTQKRFEIVIDYAPSQDGGVDPSLIVNYTGKGISLKSALRQILAPLNLTAITSDEVLLITTKDRAYAKTRVRLYPIGDLMPALSSSDHSEMENAAADVVKTIANDIVQTVSPPTWNNQGGPGNLTVFGHDSPILVISQSEEVHDQIADLLAQLRQVHRKQQAETTGQPAKPQEPETAVLRVYELRVSGPNGQAMGPQEVAEVVKGLIEPKSWTQPDVYIRGVTGKLVVRQLPSVHREIEKLLDKLGASVPTTGLKGSTAPAGQSGGGSF